MQYLLVVCTASTIVLFGVRFDDETVDGAAHLIDSELSFSTDGVGVLKVSGKFRRPADLCFWPCRFEARTY